MWVSRWLTYSRTVPKEGERAPSWPPSAPATLADVRPGDWTGGCRRVSARARRPRHRDDGHRHRLAVHVGRYAEEDQLPRLWLAECWASGAEQWSRARLEARRPVDFHLTDCNDGDFGLARSRISEAAVARNQLGERSHRIPRPTDLRPARPGLQSRRAAVTLPQPVTEAPVLMPYQSTPGRGRAYFDRRLVNGHHRTTPSPPQLGSPMAHHTQLPFGECPGFREDRRCGCPARQERLHVHLHRLAGTRHGHVGPGVVGSEQTGTSS